MRFVNILAPTATRLATLAITLGLIYAVADLIAALVRSLPRPQKKETAMNKIIFASVAGLILTQTTSLAEADGITKEVPALSNALEIAVGAGYTRHAGDISSDGEAIDGLVEGGGGLELDVMYRVNPSFAFGVYGTVAGYEGGSHVSQKTDGLGATLGVKLDWHYRPAMQIDPWVSVGAGYRGLWLASDDKFERALHGIEITRVQFGVDYRISPTFALAPYMGASAAMFIAEDRMMSSGYEEIPSNEVNWTFTAGLLARFDLPVGVR